MDITNAANAAKEIRSDKQNSWYFPLAQEADIVIADFDSATFGEWKATGNAFSHGPANASFATGYPLMQALPLTGL